MTLPPSTEAPSSTSQIALGLRRVDSFVNRIAGEPLHWWLEVGRSLGTDSQGRSARSTARAILDAAIADRRLGVAAWYTRDAVETAAFLASDQVSAWLSADRRDFSIAHSAAEAAALALLANTFIPREDADVLCAPFSKLVLG